jgi:hypothetical protein
MQNLNPLFEFTPNLDVSVVRDHIMTRELGGSTKNLERLTVWRNDILLGGLRDLMKM